MKGDVGVRLPEVLQGFLQFSEGRESNLGVEIESRISNQNNVWIDIPAKSDGIGCFPMKVSNLGGRSWLISGANSNRGLFKSSVNHIINEAIGGVVRSIGRERGGAEGGSAGGFTYLGSGQSADVDVSLFALECSEGYCPARAQSSMREPTV